VLILSRKLGESVLLGDDVSITVLEVSKGVVKLGIDAPKEIRILRGELSEAVKEANIKATKEASLEVLSSLSKQIKK